VAQRAGAALGARRLAKPGASLLVSHLPGTSMYAEYANRLGRLRSAHLAYSFNYTRLPTGRRRSVEARAFRTIDRFAVFSNVERALYAEYFGIPPERIDMLHWGVRPPQVPLNEPPAVAGDYICAVGGQGRGYGVLVEAMRRLPRVKAVIVSTPEAMQGLTVPDNVEVRLNTTLAEANNIIANSRFMVLPLRDGQVPCGHVTLVAAMHMGKAIVATASAGISDYLQDGVTGRLVGAGDTQALAARIEECVADPVQRDLMGERGRRFARAYCMEENVVAYFRGYLARSGWIDK
jgi:glycosyltransferase involved in cell wall biosynthesis